jgi:hypothetical protein
VFVRFRIYRETLSRLHLILQMIRRRRCRNTVRDAFDHAQAIFRHYLRVLANMFNGDLELTIAGYSAGEAAVVFTLLGIHRQRRRRTSRVLTYYQRYHFQHRRRVRPPQNF